MGAVKKDSELNERQEKFCQLYTSDEKELFGSGINSYIAVYEPDMSKNGWKNVAYVSVSRLLSNIKIVNRINELLEDKGFNDENVSKQHLFLLNQHEDKGVKMRAIDSYYKLKGKNQPDRIVVTKEDDNKANDILDTYLNKDDNTGNTTG